MASRREACPDLCVSTVHLHQDERKQAMGKIIGIDLGTTNSAMAVLEGGEPTIIVNSEGDRTTPSVVGFRKDGERVVGKPARVQSPYFP